MILFCFNKQLTLLQFLLSKQLTIRGSEDTAIIYVVGVSKLWIVYIFQVLSNIFSNTNKKIYEWNNLCYFGILLSHLKVYEGGLPSITLISFILVFIGATLSGNVPLESYRVCRSQIKYNSAYFSITLNSKLGCKMFRNI